MKCFHAFVGVIVLWGFTIISTSQVLACQLTPIVNSLKQSVPYFGGVVVTTSGNTDGLTCTINGDSGTAWITLGSGTLTWNNSASQSWIVSPNPSNVQRIGTITLYNLTYTVTQGGNPNGTSPLFGLDPATKQAYADAVVKWNSIFAFFSTIDEACVLIPACEAVSVPATLVSSAMGTMCDVIALDPEDWNYRVIPVATFPVFPTVAAGPNVPTAEANAFNALINNLSMELGYEQASITAINRAQAAADAPDNVWFIQQLHAADVYAFRIAALKNVQGQLWVNLQNALIAAGVQITITPTMVQSFVQGVGQNGLPASLKAALMTYGFTTDDVTRLQNRIAGVIVINSESFPAILTDNRFATSAGTSFALGTFIADVNGDGQVNCTDLGIVRAAMGTAAGQSQFDIRADVNGDGVVNIRDLAFVSQKLPVGTVCH